MTNQMPRSRERVHPPLKGRKLGTLELRSPLGQGGFAPVWLAAEMFGKKKLRDVAVKLFFLPPELADGSQEAEAWYNTIGEEAHALCRVDHPGVVRLYSIQRDDELKLIGLVMEHVSGPNLETVLMAQGPFTEQQVLDVGCDIAWALSAVHSAGLVHRDVKPSNIIRGPTGYRLIDFGIIASIPTMDNPNPADGDETRPISTLVGTPGYIAPECFQSDAVAKPPNDIYALGVTLFRLLTGAPPPSLGRYVSPPSVIARAAGIRASSSLLEMIDQLLSMDPLQRPRHAENVARRLKLLATTNSPTTTMANPAGTTLDSVASPMADTIQALSQAPSPWPLTGRAAVLSTLSQTIEGVGGGTIHVAWLTGPTGIGRSRVLNHVLDQLRQQDWRVLYARCAPELRGPLRPFIDALSALPHETALDLGVLIDATERAMSASITDAREGSDAGVFDSNAHILKGGALEDIERALLDASESEPLLIALDDLQWADASTLTLLTRLGARAGSHGHLLILGTIRDEPYPEPALATLISRANLSTQAQLQRIRLRPLPNDEAIVLLRSGASCSNDLALNLVRGAGGVPAWMVHAVSALRESEMIQWHAGELHAVDDRVSSLEIPGAAERLATQLTSYFSNGDDLARRILACVALHGGGLTRGVLTTALGNHPETAHTLDVLANTGILGFVPERQEFGFAQEMVRQAALNLTRQRGWFDEVHRALLDTLAAQKGKPADAAFLAAGYERLGEERSARLWLKRGIRAALAAGLFEEAVVLADRLAAITSTPRTRQRIGLDAVRFAILGRFFEEAKRRLDHLPRGAALSPALDLERRICRLEIARGIGDAGVEDRTLVADADALGDAALRCEARITAAGVAQSAEGLRLVGDAVELASTRDRGLEFAARVRRLEINRAGNHPDLKLADEDLRRALAIATAAGSAFQRIHVEGDLAILESDVGQTDAAIARLFRLVSEARTRRMLGQERLLLQNLSALLLRVGRLEEAADAATRTAESAKQEGDLGLAARALSGRAEALRRMGQFDAALSCIDEAVALQEQLGNPPRALMLLRRAETRYALRDVVHALMDADMAQRAASAEDNLDLVWSARLMRALYRARAGEVSEEQVRELLDECERASFKRGPLTLRLMDELRAWLKEQWIRGYKPKKDDDGDPEG